ncbi:5'-3' exoribonuclease 2-like isoform X2 [Oopsacas minuta]|uniref:5'-3' exoribonuclease n=1 Tax=Oopsacas minuta TaxID=111878 RepID=A0AAV7JLL0_9METZ|nr:5'-3' exoribonuclease 2-like isoform X2 [Oopsacas minuta]
MGVPAFFRWLSRKYPSILVYCIQEKSSMVSGVEVPIDTSKPNPNEIEYDNLYLDMNGIIHPCCHPEDGSEPATMDDMIMAIFAYIDCIFSIVRPRKLVYFAIDGVAPRAKMNQQRSRRFRAAKEAKDKQDKMSEVRQRLHEQGVHVPPQKSAQEPFDSNCITPGTDFMYHLSKCLQFYISQRLNYDSGWQGLTAVLSDANSPGEGEHKIMDYIRKQRASVGYNPNTRHVLYGADADLIMLGLATHEPHFTIIREEFTPNKPRPCEICGQLGHSYEQCQGLTNDDDEDIGETNSSTFAISKQFVFIKLYILREYLEKEMTFDRIGSLEFNFERALDDWIFMCFFVGNDFLPHLPSLEIREEAIDRLIKIYKESLHETQGYITYHGKVDLAKVTTILAKLGEVEDSIFKRRREDELRRKNQAKFRNKRRDFNEPRHYWHNEPIHGNQEYNPHSGRDEFNPHSASQRYSGAARGNPRALRFINARNDNDNFSAAKDLQMSITPKSSPNQPPNSTILYKVNHGYNRPQYGYNYNTRTQHNMGTSHESDDEAEEDRVRLWEDGWKERYYNDKFSISRDDTDFITRIVYYYTQGLCWVFSYYYQGCANWKWFYPFHYAPFASDFGDVSYVPNTFESGTKPFSPMEQLMGVFPAASRKFLPVSWQKYMLDPESSIIDFYPTNFEVDLNGKKYAWQGVGLLPFVDEERLLEALQPVYYDLTEEEKDRNCTSNEKFFLSHKHTGFKYICTIYENPSTAFVQIPSEIFSGMSGMVKIDPSPCLPQLPIYTPLDQLESINDNQIINCFYDNPSFHEGFIFKPDLLEGAQFPPPVLGAEKGPGKYFGHRHHSTEISPAKRMLTNSLPSQTRGHRGMTRVNPFMSFPQRPPEQPPFPPQNTFTMPSHNRWNRAPLFPPPPLSGNEMQPDPRGMKRPSSDSHEPAQHKFRKSL